MNKMRELSQFYTNKTVSIYCVQLVKQKLKDFINDDDVFLEPSAGQGVFVDSVNQVFPNNKIISFDIDPKREDIVKSNFLEENLDNYKDLISIGNPPFGRKAQLALDFYEKTMNHSKIVAFIVPMQFNKWGTQKQINKGFKLIYNELLNPNSFTFAGNDYPVRSIFQIWIRSDQLCDLSDLRITKVPPTNHVDFEFWQYNCTEQSMKYLNYEWDFAVIRQGYKDYNERFYNKSELNKSIQYMLFKAKDEIVLKRLLDIDFKELSMLNTSIPGFGKADLVSYYTARYG